MWADEVVVGASDGADDDEGETACIGRVAWGDDRSKSLKKWFCVIERLVGFLGKPGVC